MSILRTAELSEEPAYAMSDGALSAIAAKPLQGPVGGLPRGSISSSNPGSLPQQATGADAGCRHGTGAARPARHASQCSGPGWADADSSSMASTGDCPSPCTTFHYCEHRGSPRSNAEESCRPPCIKIIAELHPDMQSRQKQACSCCIRGTVESAAHVTIHSC